MQNDNLLKRIEEQELEAREYGFYWDHIDQLLSQIQSESKEIKEAWEKGDRRHLQEEIGDLLQAATSLAIFCNLDLHDTLLQSIEKFQKRYEHVVALAKKDGHTHLRNQSYEVLMDYWIRAKKQASKA